jgi:hypothetical protein
VNLWTVRVNHASWSAELKCHGESYGWEAQIVRETDFRIGRWFILREEAIGWGDFMKQEIEKGLDEECDSEKGGA